MLLGGIHMKMTEIYQKILDNMYEGIYFVNTEREITFWNKGAEKLTGFTAEEMVGTHCYDNKLNHIDDFGTKLCLNGCPLMSTIEDGQVRNANLYLHHKEGHRVPIKVKTTAIEEEGAIVGAVEMFVKADNNFFEYYELDELKEIAFRDQLTKLPNRKNFENRLLNEMKIWSHKPEALALAFIDIDHFKAVNDTYGHATGDEVLKMVAKSLESGIMKTDYIGRWGGEEFVCLITDTDYDTIKIIAERLRVLVENSGVRKLDDEIKVTVSLGVVFYRKGESMDSFIERADQKMYDSKNNGRNRVSLE